MSASQFLFIKLNTSGQAAVVTTAGVDHDGVLQNDPSAAGRACTIVKNGIVKVMAGTGGATRGYRCAINASGKAILATGERSVGYFMDTAAADELCTIMLDDAPSNRARGRGMNVETLTGAKTLVYTDKPIQKLTISANQDVNLPAVTIAADLSFQIINGAAGAYNLVVKNAGGSTIGTVNQNEEGLFVCDGTSWVLARIATIALS